MSESSISRTPPGVGPFPVSSPFPAVAALPFNCCSPCPPCRCSCPPCRCSCNCKPCRPCCCPCRSCRPFMEPLLIASVIAFIWSSKRVSRSSYSSSDGVLLFFVGAATWRPRMRDPWDITSNQMEFLPSVFALTTHRKRSDLGVAFFAPCITVGFVPVTARPLPPG